MRDDGGVLTEQRRQQLFGLVRRCWDAAAGFASAIGTTLEACASANIDKLMSRQARGTLAGERMKL